MPLFIWANVGTTVIWKGFETMRQSSGKGLETTELRKKKGCDDGKTVKDVRKELNRLSNLSIPMKVHRGTGHRTENAKFICANVGTAAIYN